jgi:hypothetical protein
MIVFAAAAGLAALVEDRVARLAGFLGAPLNASRRCRLATSYETVFSCMANSIWFEVLAQLCQAVADGLNRSLELVE